MFILSKRLSGSFSNSRKHSSNTKRICTGTSNRHLMSVADNLVDDCREAGLQPLGIEGQGVSDWIVVDLGEAMVHVMQEDSRRMYELEKLWS